MSFIFRRALPRKSLQSNTSFTTTTGRVRGLRPTCKEYHQAGRLQPHLSRKPWPHCRHPFRHNNYGRNYSLQNVQNDTSGESPQELPGSVSSLTSCSGCGALAQSAQPDEAGHFSLNRASVKRFLESEDKKYGIAHREAHDERDRHFANALESADPELLRSMGGREGAEIAKPSTPALPPLCDRCHNLLHHHSGAPIHHPSLQSLRDTIFESPYKYNHIYHVLDAADFPMSLVPNIHSFLKLAPLRSSNRRAKHAGYRHGRKAELSFIITRSDLIAPRKDAVDKLMPYFRETLRQAIGRTARDARLGNVMCVSSKRGWWTRELKSRIWEHGGGAWMVGKVNVGKSNLFEVAFPKGKADDVNFDRLRAEARDIQPARMEEPRPVEAKDEDSREGPNAFLLPPARAETPYPAMPTVSALPGTTASPIRIPFGNNRGEMVDLPGLERCDLNKHVVPEHQDNMIMKSRVVPAQHTIRPGQSLVLGGLVRLKPLTETLIFLAYPFVPLIPHVTSCEKIVAMANDEKRLPPHYLVNEDTWKSLSSAGKFQLKWDVTKQRAGPLTSKSVANFKPEQLPFKVLSADIVIESLGWVEIVAQVRRKDYSSNEEVHSREARYPEVEVFSPHGKYIGVRGPMGAWMLNKKKAKPAKRMTRRRK